MAGKRKKNLVKNKKSKKTCEQAAIDPPVRSDFIRLDYVKGKNDGSLLDKH